MSEKEIRDKLLAMTKVYVQNKQDCNALVERLLDLVEEVAEKDRDTAFDAGYADGLDDGAEEALDKCRHDEDLELQEKWEEGRDVGYREGWDACITADYPEKE